MLKPNMCLLSIWHGLGLHIDLLRLRVCVRVCVCVSKMMISKASGESVDKDIPVGW